VKLSDDESQWAMKVALDQSMRFGATSLGYEDYAASAVEKLLMQEPAGLSNTKRSGITLSKFKVLA
jgi:hypothetical protein